MKSKYKITYQEHGTLKTKILETHNIDDEIMPSNLIDVKRVGYNKNINFFNKIKDKDLKNILYELSLMLNSKILLDDAFDILIKNEKKSIIKKFLKTLKQSFSNSYDVSKSLEVFQVNPLVKSFFKITQDSGNISENINSLSKIISESYEVRKEFIKSVTYPLILCFTFFLALVGIFEFVVPNFKSIFENSSMELPFATTMLFEVKNIYDNYLLYIVLSLIFFVMFIIVLYNSNFSIKRKIDEILIRRLFILSDLYKLKTFYRYFVVVDILHQSKYDFFESIVKAKVLLNNQYLFDKITQIEKLVKSGKSVRFAFESTKLFDDVTLNLISTGEFTNSLEDVVGEIKNIYKKRFDDKLKLFSLLIEPLFFIIIMALIVWIILAIFVPLWSMSDMLKF